MSEKEMTPLEEAVRDLIQQMQQIQDGPAPAQVRGLAYHVKESLQNALDEQEEMMKDD